MRIKQEDLEKTFNCKIFFKNERFFAEFSDGLVIAAKSLSQLKAKLIKVDWK